MTENILLSFTKNTNKHIQTNTQTQPNNCLQNMHKIKKNVQINTKPTKKGKT